MIYKSYKEHCELYTEIHDSVAISSCQIELAQKYIILLSNVLQQRQDWEPPHEVRERIAKKMTRFNIITGIVDTDLITSTVITGAISIATFANGVGLPDGIALSETSLLLSLATVITRKSFKTFTTKQEKHDPIKVLAQSKLNSIANIISLAMQGRDISPTEFHKVLQEVEKYCKLTADIRNQAKAKVKQITKKTARSNT